MQSNKLLAYILIGIGSLFLLSRINFGNDWLWIALISAAFLWAYRRQKRYGFLITGSILAGLGVGILLNSWTGLLLSLAIGFYAIERVEPRKNRWPVLTAAILAGIGLLGWLIDTDFFGSFAFALMLLGGGAYLLLRDKRQEADKSTGDTFTSVGPQPTSTRSAEAEPVPVKVEGEDVPEQVQKNQAVDTADAAPQPTVDNQVVQDAAKDDEAFYRILETWRRETAQREDRAPYLILTNASLEQIARDKPQTLEALRDIRGIGPVKLERYGEAILTLTRD